MIQNAQGDVTPGSHHDHAAGRFSESPVDLLLSDPVSAFGPESVEILQDLEAEVEPEPEPEPSARSKRKRKSA